MSTNNSNQSTRETATRGTLIRAIKSVGIEGTIEQLSDLAYDMANDLEETTGDLPASERLHSISLALEELLSSI